jgi:hypothetical protein
MTERPAQPMTVDGAMAWFNSRIALAETMPWQNITISLSELKRLRAALSGSGARAGNEEAIAALWRLAPHLRFTTEVEQDSDGKVVREVYGYPPDFTKVLHALMGDGPPRALTPNPEPVSNTLGVAPSEPSEAAVRAAVVSYRCYDMHPEDEDKSLFFVWMRDALRAAYAVDQETRP